MQRNGIAAAVLLLLLVSCGDDIADPQTNGIRLGFGLPRTIAVSAYLSRAMVVEAVYQATILSGGAVSGQITTTGTIRVGPMGATYSPEPSDRLVLVMGDTRHEFVVTEAQGNTMAPTAAEWLASPHRLSYTHHLSENARADIAITYDGARYDATIKGRTTVYDTPFDADLHVVGGKAGVVDWHGGEGTADYTLTGKITGGGIEIDVSERHGSVSASAQSLRLPISMRGSAARINVTIDSVLHAGGDTFRFQGVEVVTDMKSKGGTSNVGIVSASGEVLRDGSAYGTVRLENSRALLDMADGSFDLDLPLGGG